MSENSVILKVENLRKIIGKNEIIKDLSFDVHKGEVFGFLGPNGAGKTTTIRMIVGLTSMTSGNVWINGKSIHSRFKEAIADVGAIVENPEFYNYLSGYKNLKHFAEMYHKITKDRINEVIKLVGLDHVIDKKVGTYSLGMRQRLGVAQALMHNPQLLILDEPTNGLDPAGIREFRDYLKALSKKENIGVVISSHLLSEIELMCDRVAIIQHGELVEIKSVSDLVDYYQNNEFKFGVNPIDKAAQVISTTYPDLSIRIEGQFLLIRMDKSDTSKIVALFAGENIEVFEVSTPTRTLEDKFLELTGGKGIV